MSKVITEANKRAGKFDVIVSDPVLAKAIGRLSSRGRVRVLRAPRGLHAPWSRIVYQVSYLADVADSSEGGGCRLASKTPTRLLLFQGDLPINAVIERVRRLSAYRVSMHVAAPPAGQEGRFLKRLVRSLDVDEGRGTILDAWREGDRFVVKSPTFEMLSAPIAGLGLLRNVSPKAIDEFEIDPYGAFVYWPRLDVHLGWDQFEQAANPAAKLRALQMSREFNARYGQAIRRFRESTGLRQCDIPGLDERTVRRVEQGRTRATAGALARLARAHGMNPTDYMARLAELLDRSTPDA